MMNRMKKLCALLLVLVLTLTIIPGMNYDTEAEVLELPSVTYTFDNNEPGNAYGTITVYSKNFDDHVFYWGDGEGNKLKYDGIEFSQLGTCSTDNAEMTATYQIPSPYTAIPAGAKELLVYSSDDVNGENVNRVDIPESKWFAEGEYTYKFGVTSDVHYNRYSDYAEDDAIPAFDNALKFYNDLGVKFLAVTGDLSSNAEVTAYDKFNTAINKYPEMTVYSIMGNHDATWAIADPEKYSTYVDRFAENVNVKKNTDSNVKDIADNGADFVYEMGGDVFIFLSQGTWKYSATSILVTENQLNWLEKILNRYANKNVHLFFHTYFASEDGNVTTAVGNLQNPGGYTYDLTYYFGAKDEVRFRKLLNKYANVTVYSGHSHWAYDQQIYNPLLNIGNINSKGTGATMIHVSSVTEPRMIEADATSRTGLNGVRSEGMMVYKYADSAVHMGVDFKTGQYLAYATYLNEDGAKTTPVTEITTGKTEIKRVGKIKKISKKSKKAKNYKVTIKYNKVTDAVGYQIQYSTKKKFTEETTKTRNTTANKYTISKLKKKTKYYIRVRAFRYQFGGRVYGQWSQKVKIKVKAKNK